MSEYVTDTHALLWHLTNDKRLSVTARAAFEDADGGNSTIWVPIIVLVEAVYLIEKARYPPALIAHILDLIDPPSNNYLLAPLDVGVFRALQTVDRNTVPEMPDRIIAATAKYLNLPLISKDAAIAAVPDLSIIW